MATAAVVSLDNNPVAAEKLPKPWVPVHPIPPSRDTSQNYTGYNSYLSKEVQLPFAPATSKPVATRANSTPSGEHKTESGIRKQRKLSSISLRSEPRRSVSTPRIGGEVVDEVATITSPVDKRKNKLGYQRTSMACGHCRRRKIRCIPPTDEDPDGDLQGRCANCIRLKKECIYFPVDHAADTRPGRREVGSISASSASSPRTPIPPAPGSVPIVESQIGRQLVHHRRSEPGFSLPESTALVSPYLHSALTAEPSPLPYHANFAASRSEDNPEWTPPEFGSSTLLPPPYWASGESTPNRPSFSPNPLSSISASPIVQLASPPLGYEQGNQAWPPSRSSSFGHLEGVPGSYPYHEVESGSDMRHHMTYSLDNQPTPARHNSLPETSVHPEQLLAPLGQAISTDVQFQQPWAQQGFHGGHGWFGGSPGSVPHGNDAVIDQYPHLSQDFYPHTTSPG